MASEKECQQEAAERFWQDAVLKAESSFPINL